MAVDKIFGMKCMSCAWMEIDESCSCCSTCVCKAGLSGTYCVDHNYVSYKERKMDKVERLNCVNDYMSGIQISNVLDKLDEIVDWKTAHDQHMASAKEILDDATIDPLCAECNHSCKVWSNSSMVECGHYDGPNRDNLSQVPIEQGPDNKGTCAKCCQVHLLDLRGLCDFCGHTTVAPIYTKKQEFGLGTKRINRDGIEETHVHEVSTIEQELEAGLEQYKRFCNFDKYHVKHHCYTCTFILLPGDKFRKFTEDTDQFVTVNIHYNNIPVYPWREKYIKFCTD